MSLPEATCVEYVTLKDNLYIFVGMANGEVCIFEYGSFKVKIIYNNLLLIFYKIINFE